MEDEQFDLSSVRKTVAPFFCHSLIKSLWRCSNCGVVNLNFSVCSEAGCVHLCG